MEILPNITVVIVPDIVGSTYFDLYYSNFNFRFIVSICFDLYSNFNFQTSIFKLQFSNFNLRYSVSICILFPIRGFSNFKRSCYGYDSGSECDFSNIALTGITPALGATPERFVLDLPLILN